jgi:hypothetical protein
MIAAARLYPLSVRKVGHYRHVGDKWMEFTVERAS